MSKSLLKEINRTSEEVNATISSLFTSEKEPKIFYEASKHLINAGGKRLRPFLALKACEVVGGERAVALPIAASIELIHTFTLVHDDIMDCDPTRRGVPTVHVLWGVPLAILAGDILFAKAYEAVLGATKQSPRKLLKIIATITQATISICEGQTSDMLFEKRRDISEQKYLKMIYKKTAALLEAAAKAGTLIGGGTSRQAKRLGYMARYAGLAFQMIDDVLGLTADEKILGKPVGSDIREGKSTMLMIHTLKHADAKQRHQILSIFGNREASPDQIEMVIQTIRSLGSIEYTAKKAENFIDKAKAQLLPFPPSQSRDSLIELCDYILSRNY